MHDLKVFSSSWRIANHFLVRVVRGSSELHELGMPGGATGSL
jgi:hypothetical protein